MVPPQRPPENPNNRTVFDLPPGGRGGDPILVPILCLAVCFKHSIILETARIPLRHNITTVAGINAIDEEKLIVRSIT